MKMNVLFYAPSPGGASLGMSVPTEESKRTKDAFSKHNHLQSLLQ